MKSLNLVYKNNSDINYEIYNFPDGQKDIRIHIDKISDTLLADDEVVIKSRMNHGDDLVLILAAVSALKREKVKHIHLYIPYILGGRSDRKFLEGGSSFLVDVMAPLINAQKFESVSVLDAHSTIAEAVIHNMINISNVHLVRFTLSLLNLKDYYLVSPDEGSSKKIFNIAEQMFYKNEIIFCVKHRSLETGLITHTSVPLPEKDKNKEEDLNGNYIIIDDICDGGRTFVEISKVIKQKRPLANVYLIVTHGIFSAGLEPLKPWFNKIFTTNSTKDLPNDNFVTQLNVY